VLCEFKVQGTGAAAPVNDPPSSNTPAIKSFSPRIGPLGTTINVTGENLDQAQIVTIGGVAMPFTILGPKTLSVFVSQQAQSGVITVVTPLGAATSSATFIARRFGGGPIVPPPPPLDGTVEPV
jgi:hypothetical protein